MTEIELNTINNNNNNNTNNNNNNNNDDFTIFDVTPDPATLVAQAPRVTDSGSLSVFKMFKYSTLIEKIFIILAIIVGLGEGVLYPIISILISDVFDSYNPLGNNDGFEDMINDISKKFAYIGAGVFGLSLIKTTILDFTSTRQIVRIRKLYIRALLEQEMGWYDAHNTGEMTSKMSGDIFLLQDAIGDKVGHFFTFLSMAITGYIIGLVKNWKTALVMLSVSPFMAIAAGIFAYCTTNMTVKTQAAYAIAGSIASETISNMRTVAALGNEKSRIKEYLNTLKNSLHVGIRGVHATGASTGLLFFFVFSAFWIGYIYGQDRIKAAKLTPSELSLTTFAILCGTAGLSQIATPLGSIAKGKTAAYRIFKTIEREPKIKNEGKLSIKEITTGNIKFEGVSFVYPTRPEQVILNNFNLEIKSGQTVGLVGASGCGKSTIVGLLQRLYEPVDGKIYIDGKDIKEFELKEYRSQFGTVGQEPSLFAMSIKDNIALGAKKEIIESHLYDTKDPQDALRIEELNEPIEECSKSANARAFINKLPEKFETVLGQRGAQVSGGQKQRISIARALMNNPKLLILDEATSALDFKSEKIVQRALDKAKEGRTCLVIAHRLSTIKNADRIIVFDRGQVVEDGNYNELMAKEGYFYKLVKNQEMGTKNKDKDETQNLEEEEEEEEENAADVILEDYHQDSEKKKSCGIFNNLKLVWRVFKLNISEWPWLLVGFIGSTCYGAIFPVFAYFFAESLHQLILVYQTKLLGIPFDNDSEIFKYFYIFIGISVAAFLAVYIHSAFFNTSGEFLTYRVRKVSFRAICRQDIAWFDRKENSTGILSGQLSADATKLNTVTGQLIGTLVQCSMSLIIGLILGYVSCVHIAWVATIFVPVIVFDTVIQLRVSIGFAGPDTKYYQQADNLMTEMIENIKTIKMLAKEEYFYAKYSSYMTKPLKRSPWSAFVSGIVIAWTHGFLFWKYSVLIYVAGQTTIDGKCEFQDTIKGLCPIIFGALCVGFAATYLGDFGKAKQAADNLFKLLDRNSKQDPFNEEGNKDFSIDDIEFENIKFRYPTRPEQVILDGVNFKIPKGKSCALVGPSGCGKSTIIQLLERFYSPERGLVKINGQDIMSYNLKTLRRKIGYVGQEPLLFQGTIGENIIAGLCCEWTDEQIEESTNLVAENMDRIIAAAKAANAHDFIVSLPNAYNTIIGERGTSLSGGQKQRIAIARALIAEPELLILDEATSALDSESERIVQEAIDKISKERTSIIIAHRLSTIKDVDKIVVISTGKVVEEGTHEELMQEEGVYHALVQIQAQ